jgi:hypothetical protein
VVDEHSGHQLPGDECPDMTDIGVAGPLARSAHDLTLAMDLLAAPLRAFGPLGWMPAAWRDNAVPAPRLRSSHHDTGTSRQSSTIATSRGLREARPIQTNSGYSANSTPTTTGSRRGDRRGPAGPMGFGALAACSCALASAGIVQACGCAFAAAFAAWPARTNAASDWIEW